jgi:hypothetical protein
MSSTDDPGQIEPATIEYHYVLRCPCGTTLTGDTEDDIVEVSLAHLGEQHPGMEYEREHILFMALRLRK